jgi:hypothetical protein
MKLKFVLGVLIFFLIAGNSQIKAQSVSSEYPEINFRTQNTGMYILGSWAVVNLVSGAIGWSRNSGQSKYFHQMNFFWNTVNLSIAGYALYTNNQIDIASMTPQQWLEKQAWTEKVLLINAGLDIGYIGTGFILRSLSDKYTSRADLLYGYGNSLLLQGSFLLIFDLILYYTLHSERLNFLEKVNLDLTQNGFSLGYSLFF